MSQIEQMDDAGIVRLLAERVMGWYLHQDEEFDVVFWRSHTGASVTASEWNPLTNDGDAMQVYQAVVDRGFDAEIYTDMDEKTVHANIIGYSLEDRPSGEWRVEGIDGPDRRRAIALAALRACGVEVK